MVGASVGSSWRACAPMSLPCFFLVAGVRSGCGAWSAFSGSFGPWCPLSSSPASCKALKPTAAMLHIQAVYAELVTFVLPPNSIPERQRSLQQFQDLLLLLPMCRVKCCSHCLLCCAVAGGMSPVPPRLLARSNDVTYVQVDSIVLWAVVLPGGSCDSSRDTIIVYV